MAAKTREMLKGSTFENLYPMMVFFGLLLAGWGLIVTPEEVSFNDPAPTEQSVAEWNLQVGQLRIPAGS